MALLKLIYLTVENISQHWKNAVKDWSLVLQQFYIKYGDRIKLDL
jgi:transposase-like protein